MSKIEHSALRDRHSLFTLSEFAGDLRGRDDRWLVAAAQNGDNEAFELLAGRYQKVVYAMASRVTRNQHDAEDVVQQTFLKAYVHLQKFRGAASFSTWLIRIALNESLMSRRKTWRSRETSIDGHRHDEGGAIVSETADVRPDPEESYSQREGKRILLSLVDSLTPATRVALETYDLGEQTLKQAATLMGISISAVKSRVSRGRRLLRRKLEQYVCPVEPDKRGSPRTETWAWGLPRHRPDVSRVMNGRSES